MEARWIGMACEQAFGKALETAEQFTELDIATLSGLSIGYYSRYQDDNVIHDIHPEIQFRMPIERSLTFDSAGKIDGIGTLQDGRCCLIEHKTSGEDIAPDSDYWMRLRFNPQIYQYVDAARKLGYDVATIIYDVTRKPSIKQKESVPVLDACGLKTIIGADGSRVWKKDGAPKQTAESAKGEYTLSVPETAEEFGDRLAQDTKERPEFYFARREVTVLDDDIEQFVEQRLNLGKMILYFRSSAKRQKKAEWAWPRNCNGMTCRSCEYMGFCLANVTVDVEQPPAGFKAGVYNPELTTKE
jgi:hypothetical protein